MIVHLLIPLLGITN